MAVNEFRKRLMLDVEVKGKEQLKRLVSDYESLTAKIIELTEKEKELEAQKTKLGPKATKRLKDTLANTQEELKLAKNKIGLIQKEIDLQKERNEEYKKASRSAQTAFQKEMARIESENKAFSRSQKQQAKIMSLVGKSPLQAMRELINPVTRQKERFAEAQDNAAVAHEKKTGLLKAAEDEKIAIKNAKLEKENIEKNITNLTAQYESETNQSKKSLIDIQIDAARKNLGLKDTEIKEHQSARRSALRQANLAGKDEAAALKAGKSATLAAGGWALAIGAAKKIAGAFTQTFKAVSGMSLSIKDNFNDVMARVSQMTSKDSGVATYSVGTSLFSNASARNLQMQFGITGSQAYGYSVASKMLGIQNEEDLMYMNRNQRNVLVEIMGKQQAWYEKMEASGMLENIQKAQLDVELFKQEMAQDFLLWMSENKGTIMTVMKVSLNVLKGILDAIAHISTLFGMDYNSYSAGSAALSDAIAGGTYNKTDNKSVNVTATLNAQGVISDQNAMEQMFRDYTVQQIREASDAI